MMEEVGDISKLKVADLKKHLKLRGLLVTGNKNELVERLQEAMKADGSHALDSSGDIDDDDFDEEEILAGDDDDGEDDLEDQEEAAVLSGHSTIRVKPNRLLVEHSEKKISLKRSEPCLSTPLEIPSSANGNKAVIPTSSTNSESESQPKRKIIKISAPESSSASVLEERAKKFGITSTGGEETRKASRAARFGSSFKPSKLSMETGTTDLETLKKRAERFGEVTSNSLVKVESVEKMKQRKERFGETTPESAKLIEPPKDIASESAKKTRAERFNLSKPNGSIATTAKATGDEDAKQKRAQRFGV